MRYTHIQTITVQQKRRRDLVAPGRGRPPDHPRYPGAFFSRQSGELQYPPFSACCPCPHTPPHHTRHSTRRQHHTTQPPFSKTVTHHSITSGELQYPPFSARCPCPHNLLGARSLEGRSLGTAPSDCQFLRARLLPQHHYPCSSNNTQLSRAQMQRADARLDASIDTQSSDVTDARAVRGHTRLRREWAIMEHGHRQTFGSLARFLLLLISVMIACSPVAVTACLCDFVCGTGTLGSLGSVCPLVPKDQRRLLSEKEDESDQLEMSSTAAGRRLLAPRNCNLGIVVVASPVCGSGTKLRSGSRSCGTASVTLPFPANCAGNSLVCCEPIVIAPPNCSSHACPKFYSLKLDPGDIPCILACNDFTCCDARCPAVPAFLCTGNYYDSSTYVTATCGTTPSTCSNTTCCFQKCGAFT
jgi:hypothetical protein